MNLSKLLKDWFNEGSIKFKAIGSYTGAVLKLLFSKENYKKKLAVILSGATLVYLDEVLNFASLTGGQGIAGNSLLFDKEKDILSIGGVCIERNKPDPKENEEYRISDTQDSKNKDVEKFLKYVFQDSIKNRVLEYLKMSEYLYYAYINMGVWVITDDINLERSINTLNHWGGKIESKIHLYGHLKAIVQLHDLLFDSGINISNSTFKNELVEHINYIKENALFLYLNWQNSFKKIEGLFLDENILKYINKINDEQLSFLFRKDFNKK